MATTAMDYESTNPDRFDDEGPRYDRDRSASPRREEEPSRRRSMSPNGTDRAPIKNEPKGDRDDDGAINPGSNLFVTGIHPRLEEAEVTRLFEKYGDVEKCQIMKDPHTGESRGFGFVKMVTPEMADAAREGLQGEVIEGRTLSIEKARRARPRTPTPGKYFGPPKRDGPGGGPGGERRGFGGDRRRGGYGGGGFRDDSYRGSRGGGYREDRGGDRSYDRGYDRGYREERGYDRGYRGEDRGYDRRDRGGDDSYARIDRYRDDRSERYAGGGGRGGAPDDRRGPSYDRGDRYERPSDREARPPRDSAPSAGYGESAPRTDSREPYGKSCHQPSKS
ncbi:Serine/arginine-rich splicing factor SR45a [Rhypophila sp. PSN 637]